MPNMDFTDVLLDTDIAGDTFSVRRPSITATQGGIATESDTAFVDEVGSVTPVGAGDIALLPEGVSVLAAIKIITPFRLQSGNGTGYEPDVVSWHGAEYTVVNVADWTGYGAGFVDALCTLRTISPVAPP